MNWLLTSLLALFFCTTARQPLTSSLLEEFRKSSVCFQCFAWGKDDLLLSTFHCHDFYGTTPLISALCLSHRQTRVTQRRSWSGSHFWRAHFWSGSEMLFFLFSDVTPELRKLFAAVPPSQLWQPLWMAGCPALSSPERPCQRPGTTARFTGHRKDAECH